MIQVKLTPEARQRLAQMKQFPARMAHAVAQEFDLQNEYTVGAIQEKRLSGKGPFPVSEGRLGVVTNRLRTSLRRTKAVQSGGGLIGSIGSNVIYAGAHEFGFEGSVSVKSYTRKLASGDRFSINGAQVRRGTASHIMGGNLKKVARTASGVATVKAHTRHMHVPERAPIRKGIEERLELYVEPLSNAIVAAWEEHS